LRIENLEFSKTSEGDLIDFHRIKQDKVKRLLHDNGLNSLKDLSKLKSYCYDQTGGKHYHNHIMSFIIHADIEAVWNGYKTISPQETRKGSMVSFGLMYSRNQNEIMYSDDPYKGIETGQIIFLNLNLFAGIVHLAVGHEITGVNDTEKTIKICYLQNGASTGTQLIRMLKKNENQTEVIHETWYRSGSLFRDKLLYPGFHEKGLKEFHENVKNKVESAVLA
jgi:hypothetical protein